MVLPPSVDKGGPGVIDFQDALRGPDRLRPRLAAQGLLHQLVARARRALGAAAIGACSGNLGANVGDSEYQFMRWFDLIGVQRHIKVLGIFCAPVASRRQDRLSRRPAADVRIRARCLPPLSGAGRVRALAGVARRAAARAGAIARESAARRSAARGAAGARRSAEAQAARSESRRKTQARAQDRSAWREASAREEVARRARRRSARRRVRRNARRASEAQARAADHAQRKAQRRATTPAHGASRK